MSDPVAGLSLVLSLVGRNVPMLPRVQQTAVTVWPSAAQRAIVPPALRTASSGWGKITAIFMSGFSKHGLGPARFIARLRAGVKKQLRDAVDSGILRDGAGRSRMRAMNRRTFIRSLAAAGCWAAWPRRLCWATDTDRAGPARFAYYTDIHTRLEWETPLALEKTARLINEQKTDLVLCGGDLITDGFESAADAVAPRWDAYFDQLHNRIEAPLYSIIGNHDLVAAMPKDGSAPAADPKAIFREKLGLARTYRSFDRQGYHFVLLDPIDVTRDALKYRGFVDDAQMAWLREDLAALPARQPVIVLTHMPLLTAFHQATAGATEPSPANRVVVNNREVLKAFVGRNLILVLQGHLHVNELLRWRNTTFITGGAVCGMWWRGNWYGTEEGFGVVTIADGRVDWEYIDLGWDARRPAGV
jgi:3',5'-cyclic AMP phosphodiesterase CpdA